LTQLSFQKIAVPELKNEHQPQIIRSVAPPTNMLIDQAADRMRLKVASLQGLWFPQ
jgi:hypothetical protein